jgi:hypothetical protein
MSVKENYVFKGAMLECCIEFPQFRDDIPVLFEYGYVKRVSDTQCKWTKSRTSLAEYFKWAGVEAGQITGGFWSPIAKAFGEDKDKLRKLAGNNGNPCKPAKSRAFAALQKILFPYHAEKERQEKELKVYNAIIDLLNENKTDDPLKIRESLQIIKKIVR